MKHRMDAIAWDRDGEWDGVVVFNDATRQFVRYLDRNGERWEPVLAEVYIFPIIKSWRIATCP